MSIRRAGQIRLAWLRACEALTRGAAVELPLATNLTTAATKTAAAILAAVLATCKDRGGGGNGGNGVYVIARFLHSGRCRGVAAQSICIQHPGKPARDRRERIDTLIAVTRDGSRLFLETDGCITVFDLHALAPLYTIGGGRRGSAMVTDVADLFVAEDGALFVATPGYVFVFEPGARRAKHRLHPVPYSWRRGDYEPEYDDDNEIQSVCANAALVAIGIRGLRVVLHSRESYSYLRTVKLRASDVVFHELRSIDFVERGSKLATCNAFCVAVFNLRSGTLLWTVSAFAIGDPMGLFCRDGAVYVTCANGICVLDAAGGVRDAWGHTERCGAAALILQKKLGSSHKHPDACERFHAEYFGAALDDNGVLYARTEQDVVATFV